MRGDAGHFLPLNLGKAQCFSCRSTRWSPYEFLTTRRLIRWVSNLELVALETVAVNRRCGGEPDGSYLLAGQIVRTKKKIQCKKMQANKSGLHLLFPANIQTQLLTDPLSRIRRRAAEARRVSLEWNAKLKSWFLPKFRGRKHQT